MQVVQTAPYDKFLQACDNEVTRKEYAAALRRFTDKYQVSDLKSLISEPTEQLEDTVIDYIKYMKNDNNRSEGYVTQQVAGIRKFLYVNRINLNWNFINQHKGKFKRKQRLQAYSHEQIQKILEFCADIRSRTIVLIFASTGIRIGALPGLKKKHLKKVGDLYEFTIYENDIEEYITYCTPECAAAIDSYLEYRKRSGEVLTPESYLIRNLFDALQVKRTKGITESTVRNVLWKVLIKAGIREVNHTADKTYRKQIPEIHGFRMFFSSQLVNANLNSEKRWLLEGHALLKNDPAYVKVKDSLYQEYTKAIDHLTIDPANRLRREVQYLTVEKKKIDVLEEDMQELRSLIMGADKKELIRLTTEAQKKLGLV